MPEINPADIFVYRKYQIMATAKQKPDFRQDLQEKNRIKNNLKIILSILLILSSFYNFLVY
jgi:hypothetical protein